MKKIEQFQITGMTISGFKSYQEPTELVFGNPTTITGGNGQGKTSIADAIAFAITGLPFFGERGIDKLHNEVQPDVSVSLCFVDEAGVSHELTRTRHKNRMSIRYDGYEIRQLDLTDMFGERDVFLSIFNPLYFIEELGDDGKNLLEMHLPVISCETVMEKLTDEVRAEQYQSKYTKAIAEASAKVQELGKQYHRENQLLKAFVPGISCPTCRRPVTEQNLPEVQGALQAAINDILAAGREQRSQLDQLQQLDTKAQVVFDQFQSDDIIKMQDEIEMLTRQRDKLTENRQMDDLRGEIQQLSAGLEYGNLSQQEYEQMDGCRAELTFEALKMNKVEISLYDVVKSTGEQKAAFKNLYSQPKMPDGRGIFSARKAKNRRNTLCISRFFNAAGREKTGGVLRL